MSDLPKTDIQAITPSTIEQRLIESAHYALTVRSWADAAMLVRAFIDLKEMSTRWRLNGIDLLAPSERAISSDLDISPARAADIRVEFNRQLESLHERFMFDKSTDGRIEVITKVDANLRRMVDRLCVALGALPRTP